MWHVSHSALLLNSVMRAFRPEFVAARATNFIGMIKDCDEAGFPKVRRREQSEHGDPAECDVDVMLCSVISSPAPAFWFPGPQSGIR